MIDKLITYAFLFIVAECPVVLVWQTVRILIKLDKECKELDNGR